MAYKVLLYADVVKALSNLDKPTSERIKKGLEVLREDPFHSRVGADIKKLKGTRERQDAYRLRIGDYRAIYDVTNTIVKVTRLIHRGENYDWLN